MSRLVRDFLAFRREMCRSCNKITSDPDHDPLPPTKTLAEPKGFVDLDAKDGDESVLPSADPSTFS